MLELNDIKINLGELRKALAQLQKDGYEEVGLEDLLRFIHATTIKPQPLLGQYVFGDGFVSPLRNTEGQK